MLRLESHRRRVEGAPHLRNIAWKATFYHRSRMMNGKSWMIGAICAALLPIAASAQIGDNTPDGIPAHFRGAFRGLDATLLSGVALTEAQQPQVQQLRQAE